MVEKRLKSEENRLDGRYVFLPFTLCDLCAEQCAHNHTNVKIFVGEWIHRGQQMAV